MLSETEVRQSLVSYVIPDLDELCYPRRYENARDSYQKVLDLDPRHRMALGFMGMVYHLLGEVDKAIVKYHEVRSDSARSCLCFLTQLCFRR